MRLFAIPILLSAWMCSAAEPAAPAGRIGTVAVSAEEVRASLAALGPEQTAALARDPALMNQLVRSLLVQRFLLKEAEAAAHDKDPAVAAKLARAREITLTESYLAAVSAPPAGFPGEDELKAAYEKAKPSIGVPRSWRLAQIFIPAPEGADAKTLEKGSAKLETVRRLLKAPGADFAKIAAEHSSEETSAARGGEIGWLAEPQIQPGIREKLGSLKLNSVSDPVRLDDGWHIVRVLDTREPYTPTLEQVRDQLTAKLREEKIRSNSQEYVARLLRENPPAVNELALEGIATPGKKN